jgi:tellurite resistance protein TerC
MLLVYAGFLIMILAALALDLGVFHRHAHVVKAKEALIWTAVWIVVSLLFAVVVWFLYENHVQGLGLHPGKPPVGGTQAMLEYLQGYLIEKSLSVDNIFVIALIFGHFNVPPAYQHRVLFWGVLGALIMRGVMIAVGAALLERFHWMMYVFGGLLLVTAAKMYRDRSEHEVHPDKTWLVRWARRVYPVSPHYDREHFFTRLADGRRAITPMFLVLLTVEFTDLIFAVDSIPAIFAVTLDPFLVFTSNVLAILGLRSLFFAVADLMGRLHYMKLCLIVLLAFIGVKMLIVEVVKIPAPISLAIIVGILAVGVWASLARARRIDREQALAAGGDALPPPPA